MKYNRYIFIITVAMLSIFNGSAQYNVITEGNGSLFYNYLVETLDSVINERTEAVQEALATPETVKARQQDLRNKYLQLLGDLPEKTDLNAEVVSTINTNDGYHIEKLHYQSVPNHHVTANFYVPETGTAPYPAVIFMCGHYPTAKTWVDYQNLSILFAKNGIACMIVDPICQYERYQALNASGGLLDLGGSGTTEQSRLEQGLINCGSSIASMQVWDNTRGVDYLYSRTDVVDTAKIGALGHSGGGAQATYLLAYDTRLKVGTVANYLINETYIFTELHPQTASQNLPYEGAMGIDQPDYVEMFAPKPFLQVNTTSPGDGLFPAQKAVTTYDEAKLFYDKLGASDAISYFVSEDAHDYTKVKREATVRWFKRWFYDNNDTVIEAGQTTQNPDDLYVTDTKNVMTFFENEKNVTDLNLEMADGYAAGRTDFWASNTKEVCLDKVKELIKYEALDAAPVYEATETIDRDYYTIEKAKITYKNHVPVTSLLYKSKDATGKLPVILYVDGRGKDADAGENAILEKAYVDNGYLVMNIDVRGFGETTDVGHYDTKHNNKEHFTGTVSLYLGKTLPGQRVQDIEKVMEVLLSRDDVDADNITIVGIDRASVAVLHAAALDARIKNVEIRQASETPWYDVINDPTLINQMTHQVPSALKYYDIPDLVTAIAPRSVVYDQTYDSRLSNIKISYGELDKEFSSEVFNYSVLNTTRDYIKISATPYNSTANPTIEGTGTYNLPAQDSVVQITVTTPDESSQSIYNITLPMYVGINNLQAEKNGVLEQNYPNPFSDHTVINYSIYNKSDVSLMVYGIDGRILKTISQLQQSAGNHQLEINAKDFSPGTYIYKLYVNGEPSGTNTMIITKQ